MRSDVSCCRSQTGRTLSPAASRAQRERLQSLLSDLALEPVRRPDVNPMVGEWKGYYRIRVGDRRIIFWLDTQEMTVYVDHIGPRGDVYK